MNNLVSKNFEDYKLLDSALGTKLEIISGVKVERPSPQAIWSERLYPNDWGNLHSRCIRKKDGGGVWEHLKGDPSPMTLTWISETKVEFKFKLKLTSFGHCGLFFEQSAIWNMVFDYISKQKQSNPSPHFLNLFGYTGAATIVAAKAGAHVTHVDSAKGVLEWGRENATLNRISEGQIRWFHSDAVKFLENSVKRGELFDGVLADPPSWGHGAKKEVWEFDKQIGELTKLISKVVRPSKSFFILTSHTHGVQHEALKNLTRESFSRFNLVAGEIGLKHLKDDRILPAGIYSLAHSF